MEIPPGLVDQHYEMDPATDDLISHGSQLRAGMIVLIEDNSLREDIDNWDEKNPKEVAEARRKNRWALVSEPFTENRMVRFVAIYADGVKVFRTYGTEFAWLVKKDSKPDYSMLKWILEPAPGQEASQFIGNVFENRDQILNWEQQLQAENSPGMKFQTDN